jgi:hypothetical protein
MLKDRCNIQVNISIKRKKEGHSTRPNPKPQSPTSEEMYQHKKPDCIYMEVTNTKPPKRLRLARRLRKWHSSHWLQHSSTALVTARTPGG